MSIPELKIAEQLFSKKRLETGAVRRETTILQGTALSDSEDGYVAVDYPGNVTVGETTEIRIPTGPAVKAGDSVEISLTGGTGKSPMVSNVPGWGDRQQQQINRSLTAYTDDSTYYLLSATVPATPTDETWEAAGWSTTEPVVSQEDTRTLYVSRRIELVDGTVTWSAPAKVVTSASIEVAKNAILASVSETYATKDEALNTASGSGRSITTEDAAGLPLRSLTVYGESVQDGTPTPDAPVPIKTVRGINLLPFDIAALKAANTLGTWDGNAYTYRGVTATLNSDGTITIDGTATGNYTLYIVPTSSQIRLPVGSYTLTGELPGTGSASTWYFQATTTTTASGTVQARNRDFGSGVTFAVNASTYGVAVFLHMSSGDTFDNATLKPQLVAGTSAMPFVPYGSIGIGVTHDGTEMVTPIALQGHVLASLPDGTQDELHVESGRAWIDAATAITTTATTDGITATVGVDAMSTTGDLRDGATVIYAATPSTIDLGEVSLPKVQDGDTVRIIAEVTPEFDTSWWRDTDIVGRTTDVQSEAATAARNAQNTANTANTKVNDLSSRMLTVEAKADGLGISVGEMQQKYDGTITNVNEYFKFKSEGLEISKSDSPMKMTLSEEDLIFTANGQEVMKLDAVTSTVDADRFQIGVYRWQEMGNAIALVYVGGGN